MLWDNQPQLRAGRQVAQWKAARAHVARHVLRKQQPQLRAGRWAARWKAAGAQVAHHVLPKQHVPEPP